MTPFKKLLLPTLALCFAVGLGTVARGYTDPISNPPGNNAAEPVDESPTNQAKSGNLSVNQFTAIGNARFSGTHYRVDGIMRGALGQQVSNVRLGDAGAKVGAAGNDSFHAKKYYKSAALAHGEPGVLKKLCGNDSGDIVICTGAIGGPTVTAADITAYSNASGPGDPNATSTITCTASLSQPARAAGETVKIRYEWTSYNEFGANSGMSDCMLTISPGETSKTETSTMPGDASISNDCVLDSSANVPAALAC